MTLLQVDRLVSGYHKKVVLHGVSTRIEPGEKVAVIGHNGAGKTTMLKSIFGIIKPTAGQVFFEGEDVTGRAPSANVREGMALVPQERAVFPNLNIRDNLELAAFSIKNKEETGRHVADVQNMFPILRERSRQQAGTLSGGEQRMLAIGIALMQTPRLLMLDEPSLGLAPLVVQHLMNQIQEVNQRLGTAILLVEQNVRIALAYATRVYVMKLGQIVYDGSPDPLQDKSYLMELF